MIKVFNFNVIYKKIEFLIIIVKILLKNLFYNLKYLQRFLIESVSMKTEKIIR